MVPFESPSLARLQRRFFPGDAVKYFATEFEVVARRLSARFFCY